MPLATTCCAVNCAIFALADLDDVRIGRERAIDAGPACEQRLATTARECEVHARSRAEARSDVIVPRVREVAVAVDVHETAPARESQPAHRAQQHAAVTTDDHGKFPGGDARAYLLRQLQRELADRIAVADARPGLRFRFVSRTVERKNVAAIHAERLREAGIDERLRRPPGAGFMIRLQHAKPEIARSQH